MLRETLAAACGAPGSDTEYSFATFGEAAAGRGHWKLEGDASTMIVLPRLGGTSSQVGLHDVTNVFRSPKAMRGHGARTRPRPAASAEEGSRAGKVQLEPLSSTSPSSTRKNESPDLDKLEGLS